MERNKNCSHYHLSTFCLVLIFIWLWCVFLLMFQMTMFVNVLKKNVKNKDRKTPFLLPQQSDIVDWKEIVIILTLQSILCQKLFQTFVDDFFLVIMLHKNAVLTKKMWKPFSNCFGNEAAKHFCKKYCI